MQFKVTDRFRIVTALSLGACCLSVMAVGAVEKKILSGQVAEQSFTGAAAKLATPANAPAFFAKGLQFYKQKDYSSAAQYFEQSLLGNPRDANTIYYCALSSQQSGNIVRAKQLYQYLVTNFANSEQARLSTTALQQLGSVKTAQSADGGAGASSTSASMASDSADAKGMNQLAQIKEMAAKRRSAPGRAPDFAALPDQGKFSFERAGRHVQISAEVNGRSVPMIFDTGAPITTMNASTFESMGGVMPTREADGQIGGIGSGVFGAWTIPVTIKVGPITRVKFPLVVSQSTESVCLLGQDFFSPFQFTIDDASSTISFTKSGSGKSSTAMAGSSLSVPFRWKQRHMIVDAKINGKPYACIFDTGAHGICFTKKTMKDLNMTIPADAAMGHSQGIGGITTDWRFSVDSITLGPVVKKDIEVSVVDDSHVEEPLLGQTLFDDFQYTVDYDKNIIQFLRR